MSSSKPWAEDESRLVAWLKSRPGVFGPLNSKSDVWQDAFRAFGGCRSGLRIFKFECERVGYSVESVAGGFRLDLSDARIVEEASE